MYYVYKNISDTRLCEIQDYISYTIIIISDTKERQFAMEQLTRKAYAKINLGLDVLRRRPDGYHEVKMIMQTVDIYDTLTFRKLEERELSEKEKSSTEPVIRIYSDHETLPCNKSNLIYKAAALVMKIYEIKSGVAITLEKRIPIAAGMAGGSTDAAAVFHGLNELFELGMSPDEMKGMGVTIGADVPYCIMGGTALSEGIGEILTRLPAPPKAYLLVAKPDINVSTKFVYENLHADTLSYHPDIDGMAAALKEGSLEGITDRMGNVLETVTEKEYPVIARIKEEMKKAGAENALMSGSGPTVFGIYRQKEIAQKAYGILKEQGLAKQIFVTEFAASCTDER